METLGAGAAIVGLVNGVQLATLEDKRAFYYFLVAVGAGVVFGLLGLFGLTLETGLVAGLGSSGLYKVAKKIGGE